MKYFFFFNDTATTEIYTLSLHDALPIFLRHENRIREIFSDSLPRDRVGLTLVPLTGVRTGKGKWQQKRQDQDRKSTRLNSSHSQISYAVFCLKKKKIN